MWVGMCGIMWVLDWYEREGGEGLLVDEGEEFIINEYDGSESIQLKSKTQWITA